MKTIIFFLTFLFIFIGCTTNIQQRVRPDWTNVSEPSLSASSKYKYFTGKAIGCSSESETQEKSERDAQNIVAGYSIDNMAADSIEDKSSFSAENLEVMDFYSEQVDGQWNGWTLIRLPRR